MSGRGCQCGAGNDIFQGLLQHFRVVGDLSGGAVMNLKELGGEFSFLERIIDPAVDKQIVVPNGDDAAVIQIGDRLCAVSTDTLVEGDHFSLEYFAPHQIGIKAIESSVSDIAAVGGKPGFVFVSVCLPGQTEVDVLDGIYEGLKASCRRTGCEILGGDTTHGTISVISITAVGFIENRESICTRGGAKAGDLICVTGELGSSAAGLLLFRNRIDGFKNLKNRHLEPRARIDLVDRLAQHASAMIDVSDGLSSEIHHISKSSGCGAVIREEDIPLASDLREAAARLDVNPFDLAYSGGEDFELLYTLPPERKGFMEGWCIGVMKGREVVVEREGKTSILKRKGWDHFLQTQI